MSQRPVLHVCTVASREIKLVAPLQESCTHNGISLEVLGQDMPFQGFGEKFLHVQQFIKTLPDTDVLLFVDAFDVLLLARADVIIDKFLKFNAPFVVSAERTCWPFRELAPKYPKSPTSFQYLNSGTYIGYVSYIKQLFCDLSPVATEDDQGMMTCHYLKHPEMYTLDTFCELFLTTLNISDELAIDVQNKSVHCLETKTSPCVIHGNGQSLWYRYLYNRFFNQEHRSRKLQLGKKSTMLLELQVGYRIPHLIRYLKLITEFEYDKSCMTIFFSDLKCDWKVKAVIDAWTKENKNQYKQIIFDSLEIQKIPVSDIREEVYKKIRLPTIAKELYDYHFFVNCDSMNSDFHTNELGSIVKHIGNS